MDLSLLPFGATAKVHGSEVYSVSFMWPEDSHGTVKVYCTCPYFRDGNFCKHLWAVILEIDAKHPYPHNLSRGYLILVPAQPAESRKLLAPSIRKNEGVSTDWRKAFHPIETRERRQPVRDSRYDIFIVLEENGFEETSVKLRFFEADRITDVPRFRPLALPTHGDIRHPDHVLQSALSALSQISAGEIATQSAYLNYRAYRDPTARTLQLRSLRILLPQLLETSRVFADQDDIVRSLQTGISYALQPVKFSSMSLKVIGSDQGHRLSACVQILPTLELAPTFVPISDIHLFASPNLFRFQNYLGFLDLSDEENVWFNELSQETLLIPPGDEEPFLEAVLNQSLRFELPESLNWERASLDPNGRLELRSDKETGRDRYLVTLKFQYGSRLISYENSIDHVPSAEDKKIYVRSRAGEEAIFACVATQFLSYGRQSEGPFLQSQNLVDFVKSALENGIPVIVDNKRIEEASDFQISVSSGLDWFDVNGEARFSGMWVKYPSILDAINRGEKFVPLPNGSVGLVNQQITERLQKLAAFGEKDGEKLRFSSAQGLVLNALLENEKNLKFDKKFSALREKIKNFSGIAPAESAPTFSGKLRKYQREGLGWLEFLESFGLGGILADDMGLGKTIQCLAFLEARRLRKKKRTPSLLVAPKSLLENWYLEAAKFTPEMKVLIHAGTGRENSESVFMKYDLVVATYQTMRRDFDVLKQIKWDCIVADEAQAIKNSEALISKATKLLPAHFRLAMTGTPIENSIQDLFSISDFVNPGFLNGKRRSANLKLGDDARKALSIAFKPVVLRRTKDQVLKDLPEKTEQLISVDLEPKQLKIYNELKRFYQSQLLKEVKEKGIHKSQIQILAALTRLRQVALHPGLISVDHLKAKSSKFEVMLEMLEEIISEGHRVLIFSQFTRLLELLKKELKSRKIDFSYLDGKTLKRQHIVDEFKVSKCPVFLMSLKAGGVGLNLVEADYVFLMDPWWNPAVEAQAIDRVHRIGQKRAVNAYRFIAKNTVEEKILELQNSKRGLSAEILGQRSDPIRSLTASDIENLFS